MAGFHYHEGALYADDVSLSAIAADSAMGGTPCYVYSRARVLENLARLRTAFPKADIHYSLKANANLSLVRLMLEAGVGVDAVSGGEIYRAFKAGAMPSQIVFAGVGKTLTELNYALQAGIGWINVESLGEFERLVEIAQAAGICQRVALRINPDVHADTHRHIDTGHAASKFGIALDEAADLLARYAADEHLRETLNLAGLHVHIGSQIGSPARTAEAIRALLPLFERYPFLTALDLGGGFPVSYMGESVPSVEDFAAIVNPLLAGRAVRLMLEPGRYIVADAGVLMVAVQYLKHAPDSGIAITNGGMTELIRPALYGAQHAVMPVRQPAPDAPVHTMRVVGPVCESADVLAEAVPLPALRAGDLLCISHAGAYGAVMGSNYNARPRAPEILVEGAKYRLVRRGESWGDLVRAELGL